MAQLGLERDVVDAQVLARTVASFRAKGVVLPRFAQLADPATIPPATAAALADLDPDAPHPATLFRVHWYNDVARRGVAAVPAHLVLPPALTGVPAPVVVALGRPLPDDPLAQGHRGLRLPGAAAW